MRNTPTHQEKIRRLPWFYALSASNSIFSVLTFFGTVFVLFLDKLGLPKNQIGFILSLFPFCAVLALFIAPTIRRRGLKRTFLIFWGMRKVSIGFLLITPMVLSRYGVHSAFIYVAAVIVVFGVCRAVAETAYYPWMQEALPNNVLGRVIATGISIYSIGCLASTGFAGYVIARSDDLGSFMLLIAIGLVFGFISLGSSAKIPGGAPQEPDPAETHSFRGMIKPAADRNFRLYLLGVGMIAVSTGIGAFIPLYLAHEVGISSAKVVLLSISVYVGGSTSYVWGWASDRYGGKPVLILCLALSALVPLFLVLTPGHSPWSFLIAAAIMFGSGAFANGHTTASQHLLFVGLVPPEKKTTYMALNYAWIGLAGGLSPILAGLLLEQSKGISGHVGVITLNTYTPLLLLNVAIVLMGVFFVRSIRVPGESSAGTRARTR